MKHWIENNILKVITLFILLGPIFDIITSFSIHIFSINFNFIIIIKILFLLLLVYYVLFISKHKERKKVIIYGVILFIYMVANIFHLLSSKDISVFGYEFSNLIRNFFFPICLVGLFIIYSDTKEKILSKTLGLVFLEYFLLLFIPIITHTGFDSYAYSKVGSIGWFNSTNEIGGIITILLPFFLSSVLSGKKRYVIIFLIPYLYVVFSMGSKVPVLITCMTILFFLILYFIKYPKYVKVCIIPCIILLSLSIYMIPKTNFYKNIVIHLEFLEIKNVQDLMTLENMDHFIFSSRLKFLKETKTNYNNGTITDKWLGIGYIENYGTDALNIKTIEMDYFDLLYREGIIGFILFMLPVLVYLTNIKKECIIEAYSLFLAFLLALFQGHILVAPSVSIYVAIIMLNGGMYEKLCSSSQL